LKIMFRPSKVTATILDRSGLSVIIKRNAFFSLARPAQEWLEDIDPNIYIEKLKGKADIFTFWDRIPSKMPRMVSLLNQCKVFYELDNIAAIPLVNYDYWWENQIGKKTRNMIRKSVKMGVKAITVPLSDALIRAIEKIYNETPIRQGKPFWHYGVKFDQIKRAFTAEKYPCEFICAFYKNEIVGFIHLLYSKETAVMNQILSMQKHWDKAPNNVLIAKAVEVTCQKGVQYLVYERMPESSLGEFKRRNGFQKMHVTRYYIPLSFKGKLVLTLKLQRGFRGILPVRLKSFLRPIRNWLLRLVSGF